VLHRKTEFDNVKAKLMKKHSEATQTLRAGCSKADRPTNKQKQKQTGAITIHCTAYRAV